MSNYWLEKDLSNQRGLNSVKKNTNPSLFNCWLYKEADQYFLTDSESKIKVTLNPKCINRLKKLKTEHKFIKIYLKQYFYSSNINFKSSGRERYLFMFIEDFESSGMSTQHIDIAKLNILNSHPSLNNRRTSSVVQQQSSFTTTSQSLTKKAANQSNNFKNDSSNGNLSALVNNLTQDGSFQDYTIDIIENKKDPKNEINKALTTSTSSSPSSKTATRSSRLKNNLNEGFFNDSGSQPSISNKENSKELIFDDVTVDLKNHPVKISTQLAEIPNATLDFSAINSNYCTSSTQNNVDVNIKTTKSCIKITLINESPVQEINTNEKQNVNIEANFKTPVKIKNQLQKIDDVDDDDDKSMSENDSPSIIDADNEDTNTSDNKSINPQVKILDTQHRKPPFAPLSTHLSHPSTPSINTFKNHLTPFNRRESVQSNISDASLDASFDNFLNNTSQSPNKFKRKRKLIKNQVADDILQQKDDDSPEKSNDNKNLNGSMNSSASTSSRSRSSSSSSSISSYMSLDSSITEVCSKSLIFAPKSYYMYKERLFKKSCSERKPPPTSKFARPISTNPISQIFSPRSTSKSNNHVKSLFKNNQKHSSSLTNMPPPNQKDANSIEQQQQNNANLASNVLDKLINIEDTNRLKKNVSLFNSFSSPNFSTSPNSKQTNNHTNSSRRKRLFNPNTFNIDTAFDLPMQPILIEQNVNSNTENNITENEIISESSQTAATITITTTDSSNILTSDLTSNNSNQADDSKNDTNKDSSKSYHSSGSINISNQEVNKSDKSIPSGQNPNNPIDENTDKKVLNDNNSNNTTNKSINLITSPELTNASDSISDSSQLAINIMNCNFQLNPDSLQSYLVESKNLVDCLEVIN